MVPPAPRIGIGSPDVDQPGPDDPKGVRQARFTPPPGSTVVLLVRHGESAPAHPDRPFPLVDGHGDPPLHTTGLAQADAVGAHLASRHHGGETIDAIYVTTLQRTHQTAAPLSAAIGITPRVEADLREVHLGDWEGGRFRTRMAAGDPIAARMLAEERWDLIPGAEPHQAFDERVMAGLGRIVAAHPDQRVVAVAHGGVIGHILHRTSGSSRWAFITSDNGSISEIVVTPTRSYVRGFNQTSHLPAWQ